MKKLFLIIYLILLFNYLSFSQDIKWDLEIFTGYVYSFLSPLKVYQDNFPTLSFNAKYKTDPFKLPPYYDLRVIRWKDDKGWDFEFFHQAAQHKYKDYLLAFRSSYRLLHYVQTYLTMYRLKY